MFAYLVGGLAVIGLGTVGVMFYAVMVAACFARIEQKTENGYWADCEHEAKEQW